MLNFDTFVLKQEDESIEWKIKEKNYGAEGKHSSVQQIHKSPFFWEKLDLYA